MLGPATFTIVACDLKRGDCGVATQSKFFAVGAAVPHARTEAGAVATQSWFDPTQGPRALALLARGLPAEAVLAQLLKADPRAGGYQTAIIDREGSTAAWTGAVCAEWAGHRTGSGFCCLGNYLSGPQVLEAMSQAFQEAVGPLAERMLTALAAGQQAGGDRRGRQSAALLVARAGHGFAWQGDRYIDIRVDDHPEPLTELDRLLRVFRATVWGRLMEPIVVLDSQLIRFVQDALSRLGLLSGESPGEWDSATRGALLRFCSDLQLEIPLPLDGVALPRIYFQALLREYVQS